MKKKIFYFIIAFVILSTPFLFASASIVPDCNTGAMKADGSGYVNSCDFNAVIKLIDNVISFLLFDIATPLVALIICYVGFLMITSGGSSEKATKAKHIFSNVVIGYVIGLAAWLIVKTILTTVGFKGPLFLK